MLHLCFSTLQTKVKLLWTERLSIRSVRQMYVRWNTVSNKSTLLNGKTNHFNTQSKHLPPSSPLSLPKTKKWRIPFWTHDHAVWGTISYLLAFLSTRQMTRKKQSKISWSSSSNSLPTPSKPSHSTVFTKLVRKSPQTTAPAPSSPNLNTLNKNN